MATRSPRASAPAIATAFTLSDVSALVGVVEQSDVTQIAWTRRADKVVIRRGGPAAESAPAQASAAAPAPTTDADADARGTVVSSPFVGTFYRAAPHFTEVGARVKKGQVLGVVEAMNLLDEIVCEVDGTVAEIYVQNATIVEYGEKLFRIV